MARTEFPNAVVILIEDVDGDMTPDLVVADQSGYVGCFMNDGSGQFGRVTAYGRVLSNIRTGKLADVDGDGSSDLVLSRGSALDTLIWCRNDGSGDFLGGSTFIIALSRVKDMAVGDLDGDGDPDIVVYVDQDNAVRWFENIGNGQFFDSGVIIQGLTEGTVCIADVNNDGLNDVIIGGTGSTWGINSLVNSGNGPFINTGQPGPQSADAREILVGDVDADGIPDLVVREPSAVALHRGVGDGSFHPRVTLSGAANTYAMGICDLDGDLDPDIWVSRTTPAQIQGLLNDGGGSFTTAGNFTVGNNAVSIVAFGDLTSDGRPEAVYYTSSFDQILMRFNNGTGWLTPAPVQINQTSEDAMDYEVADMDGDGDMDILAVVKPGHKIAWYENDGGNGGWNEHIISAGESPYGTTRFITGDLEGDGDIDILRYYNTGSSNGYVGWMVNNGSGNFSSNPTEFGVTFTQQFASGDIDQDGIRDLICFGGLYCWRGLIGGGFMPREHIGGTVIGASQDGEVADIDGDGDNDIFFSPFRVMINNGAMGFSYQQLSQITPPTDPQYLADMDGDGDLDIIYRPGSVGLNWLENDGMLFYTIHDIPFPERVYPNRGLAVGDMNNDGTVDLVASCNFLGEGCPVLFLNDGTGEDGVMVQLMPNGAQTNGAEIEYADVDMDGVKDLILSFNRYETWLLLGLYDIATQAIARHTNAGLFVYPNPARDLACIQLPGRDDRLVVEIYNTEGRMVRHFEQRTIGDLCIPRGNLVTGEYLARISLSSGVNEWVRILFQD